MNFLRLIERWWWLLVIALFSICVALKLNGSSIGMWQEVLHEPRLPRGLLLFKPEAVRIDEWRVVTPSMLSQARHVPAFPIENDNLGAGRAPLLMSVPVAYYTTLFRPQLWGFFLFDFEHGFSFYWCCKIFGLLMGWAWLLRQIGIKRRPIILFGTVWLFFSSFVQWWFSSPPMLPEMIACWAMMTGCILKLFSSSPRWQLALALCGFVFFGMNFVLCLYPGFQVSLLYATVAIVIGIWVERRSTNEWRPQHGLLLLGAAMVSLIAALLPFWCSVQGTLKIIAQARYPGVYRNSGGGLSLFELFSGVIGFFESEKSPPFRYHNICEASNFYPLWVVVLLALVVAKLGKRITVRPLIIAVAMSIVLVSLYCLIPVPTWLAHGSFLAFSNERRLLLGVGVANILLCCIFFDSYRERILPWSGIIASTLALLCLGAGLWLTQPYADKTLLVSIVVINALIVGLFFWERARLWFLITFAALLMWNSAGINPLMRGLSPLLDAPALTAVERLHRADHNGRWLIYENADYAQMAKATGAAVFNGTKIVPDLELMRQLDPEARYESIYNRHADIDLILPARPGMVAFNLVALDSYEITLPPELPWLQNNGYRYVVFPRPWLNASLHEYALIEQIEPAHLYIYKRETTLP